MRKLHSSFVYLGLITFTPIITNPPYWDKFIAETRWSYVLLTLRHHVSCTCNLMKILAINVLIFFMNNLIVLLSTSRFKNTTRSAYNQHKHF